jgi:alpha-2-macroglobulin
MAAMAKVRSGFGVFLTVCISLPTLAAELSRFTPEGEVGGVAEVRAKFSKPMVALGDRKAAAPFVIDCAVPAQSYWDDDSQWVYAFEKNLPAGIKCVFTPKPKLQTFTGETIRAKASYAFSTGGPRIVSSQPSIGSIVEEHAAFILTLSSPVDLASVQAKAYCALEGVSERVPLKILQGKDRLSILRTALGDKPREASEAARFEERERHSLVVQCAQAATPNSKLALIWAAGIQSTNGVVQTLTRRVEFKVHEAFTASISCERENAQAPCTPIRPITLSFSSPVSLKFAEQLRLKARDGSRQPKISTEAKKEDRVDEVKFMPPFPENAELSLEVPKEIRDGLDRSLSNSALFPLQIKTASAPPLAKFASVDFGLIERKAEPVLPITLRRIELPQANGAAAKVRRLAVQEDVQILQWFGRLRASANGVGSADEDLAPLPKAGATLPKEMVRKDSRAHSLLSAMTSVEQMALPAPKSLAKEADYPFEVVGLPMPKPGFFVLELESSKLGAALLANNAAGKAAMFVKTSVLVTNLAVHFRQGAENSLVWVTELDTAKPVKDAALRITDCNGRKIWEGRSDAQGQGLVKLRLTEALETADKQSGCGDENSPRFIVSARATGADGVADLGFVLSDWNQGIESWRFNLSSGDSSSNGQRHHAVLDRSLLRAGETVSLKLFSRQELARGLGLLPQEQLPKALTAFHVGSDDSFPLPLMWRGNRYALAQWKIPKEAKLGAYELRLPEPSSSTVASFRVSEFKLPSMTGRVQVKPGTSLISPTTLALALQLDFLSAGPASNHAMTVSALLNDYRPSFASYEDFRFREVPADGRGGRGGDADAADGDERNERRLIADKVAAALDGKGTGAVTIDKMPVLKSPAEVQLEASYSDANGEIQTLSNRVRLWPSGVVVGLKTESWVSVEKALNAQVVVLNAEGKPIANHAIEITGRIRDTLSTRKRLVGGFYAYDNSTQYRDLGRLCSATTNAQGLVTCKLDIKASGNVELIAQAKDGDGRISQAYTDLWVTERGELWFEGSDQDRIDLIPEKRRYQAGEVAKFQVRMPFRMATALVSVEREGVIDSFTVQLTGRDPTIEVPIKAHYGPNVFVSVLLVRERLREVPWYSFFQWGWRSPKDWWQGFRENLSPGATVDLAKPAHKLGIAEVQVGLDSQALQVQVKADQNSYQVRGLAKVKVKVSDPQGKPLPSGASVAFAAVDQALLELANNDTWNLLDSMWLRRGYALETFTAQMHVVGKRHYGRKAAPPGGGGGLGPTREIFDTLLLWNAEVTLNEKGEADLEVPLNDSLSRFKLVAIADHGDGQFGTGSSSIETKQDLQLVSGMPTMTRVQDVYRAGLTLRNTTARSMTVEVNAALEESSLKLAPQSLTLPAQGAQEVFWSVSNREVLKNLSPETVSKAGLFSNVPLTWSFSAKEIRTSLSVATSSGASSATASAALASALASDRLKIVQTLSPTLKTEVQQSSLAQWGSEMSAQPLGLAPQAAAGSGRVQVSLSRSLLGSQSGLRLYFANYPFACLEQRTSKAIGLRDEALWRTLVTQLPLYLDADGLAMYFPASTETSRGYDILTAYLLAASHEAGWELPDKELNRMQRGLIAFVEGKISREFWSPQKDLAVRKLAAIEALSRRHAARPAMLDSITEDLLAWPTQAIIDYYQILKRMPEIRGREVKLKNADNALRGRLSLAGNRMGFTSEQSDGWWWLMGSADLNANRLILATMGDPAWQSDLSKLVAGSLARQQRGMWSTTTANVWGSLMLEKFAKDFERMPVSGQTRFGLLGQRQIVQSWGEALPGVVTLPISAANAVGIGSEAGRPTLQGQHLGEGRPWAQINVLAAVPRTEPVAAGYRISKTVTLLDSKAELTGAGGAKALSFNRGDMVRVKLTVHASTAMTWVVLDDPIPAGSVVQGRGLRRDSALAVQSQNSAKTSAVPIFQEIGYTGVKSYFDHVPKGEFSVEYTVRLNTRGEFTLPVTRAEAMYAPEVFGETPSPLWLVK